MSSTDYQSDVIESRVDWLTMTASGTQERLDLAARAEEIVRDEAAAGNDARPWAHWGYSGFGTRQAHWGERPDTDILMLSGAVADKYLAEVLPLASHVSRLDTCVTVRVPDAPDDLIRREYNAAIGHVFAGGHKPSYELLQHSRKGDTLYIGSRSSRTFGRLYNKHRESELAFYAGCYRYEVEYKNNVAEHSAHRLLAHPDRGATIQCDLHSFFEKRGVQPIWTPSSRRLPGAPFRPHSDDNRRLLWLSGQVRKSVEGLIERGLEDQVRFALGLDRPD